VNSTPFTIIGVMPAKFYGVDLNEYLPDMWVPITMQQQIMLQPSLLQPDGLFWIHMMARRKPQGSTAEAQAWVTAQFQRFLVDRAGASITSVRRKQIDGTFIPLLPGESGLSHYRATYRAPLAVLMAMVCMVLLIACGNLANLLLAKAKSREREFCVRLALGSSRSRIMRQIFTETLMLALLGGALGLALAFWTTRALIVLIAGGATHHTALAAAPDVRVLAFTSAVCVLSGILFGIAPAWAGSRSGVSGALNTRTGTTGRSGRLLPKALVIAQVTFSLILLSVAGLLLRSLSNLRSQDLGFNRSKVLLIRTNAKFAGYKPAQLNALYDRILDRVNALPGVRAAALSGAPPMSQGSWGSPIFIDNRPPVAGDDVSALLNRVSRGYFETLGIPLLRGRTLGAQDSADAPKAAVVNQTLADRYFPRGDALGHSFSVADPGVIGTWQIVGIVRDAKYNSPAEKPQAFAYLAVTQITGDDQYAYVLQIRSVGDPAKITSEVRAALAEIDANLPILETITIAEEVDHLIDEPKLISRLSGVFSLLALLLASIGLYGVITYSVVRRTSELGVRMALGAAKSRVRWMVMKESLLLLAIGVALGVPASLAASRVIRAGLFGISATDPMTLIAAVSIITAVLLAAAWMPARRATRIDPMVALRYE
jgi:predicted permease